MVAEPQAAGIQVADSLPDGAQRLTSLSHDGEPLTSETHAEGTSRGATFNSWNLLDICYYTATRPQRSGR